MTLKWTNWEPVETYDEYLGVPLTTEPKQLIPYVHWSTLGPGEDDIGAPRRDDGCSANPSSLVLQGFRKDREIEKPWFQDFEGLQDPLPLPVHASSSAAEAYHELPEDSRLPELDRKPVIIGVIDIGMPLGHWRTRLETGRSRILAAWQMLGEFNETGSDVPFGRELLRDEIDHLLKSHSGGAQDGELDQEAFNRATDGVTMIHPGGQGDLEHQASHGAHVLDWAAGDDPFEPKPVGDPKSGKAALTFRDDTRIIAVNAPSATTFGAGGTYLEQFLFHAIARIVMLSDAIWKKNFAHTPGELDGFKVVINLAFGRQAAAEQSFDRFRKALKTLTDQRKKDWERVDFIMPVGNDNQAQSNAFLEPEPELSQSLDWHIPPQDQSSNFVEIWSDDLESGTPPVTANLCSPYGSAEMQPLREERNIHFYSDLMLGGHILARVYAERVLADEDGRRHDSPASTLGETMRYRLSYIFCIAPTYRPTPAVYRGSLGTSDPPTYKPDGVAGQWKLSVHNASAKKRRARVLVQTDQQLTPNRTINQRSFFEHPEYRHYDSMGRVLDSYSFPPDETNGVVNQDIATDTPIRRHGTMLGMAAHGSAARIGGFRAADGRPAFYSATGRGRDSGADIDSNLNFESFDDVKRAPTASFPTEDSPALFGILGAGSSDGSVAALRGTSFATPQATRTVVSDILIRAGGKSAQKRLYELAQAIEKRRADQEDIHPTKPPMHQYHGLRKPAILQLAEALGGGRLLVPYEREVQRR